MENKKVGGMILGIAVLLVMIVLIFNSALKDIVKNTCGEAHSLVCPMNITINDSTYLALAIVGLLVIIALFLMFSKPQREIVVKTIKNNVEIKRKPIDKSKLLKEEKTIVGLLEQSNGGLFQSDLVEKSGFSKVKVTRILDKLEGKQIIERKRRGMSNFVLLK